MKKHKLKLMSFFMVFLFMINFIMPCKVLANESEKEVLLKEINVLKSQISRTSKSNAAYLGNLALRSLNEPILLNEKIYENYGRSIVCAKNIMNIFSAKEDINKEIYKKSVDTLVNSLNENGFVVDSSGEGAVSTAMCITALEMIKADYNKEMAKNALFKYIEKEKESIKDPSNMAIILIGLSKINDDKSKKYIDEIVDKLSWSIEDDGNILLNPDDIALISYNSTIIQALIAVGEDPTEERWISDDGKGLLDGLNGFKVNTEEKAAYKLAALVDLYNFKYGNKKSMYNLEYETVQPKEIKFKEKTLKAKIGKETNLDFDVYDNTGSLMAIKDVNLKSNNEDIITVKDNKILPLKEGKAVIEVSLKSNSNIKNSIEVQSFIPTASKIEIKINDDDLPIKVNDRVKLNVYVTDSDGDEVKDANVEFESENKDNAIVDEKGIFTGKKVGNVNIKAYIKNDKSIYVLKTIEVVDNLGLDEITKDQNKVIKEQIDQLLLHYNDLFSVEGLAPLALNKFNVNKRIYLNTHIANSYDYAKAIFLLKGANENVQNYKNRNFLKELVDLQVKDGENKGLFVKIDADKTNLAYQSYAILALDLCNAKYDKESAVKAIIDLYENKKYNVDSFNDVESKAALITVLAGCKKTNEINRIIKQIVIEFKNKFNNGENFNPRLEPRAISMVIQSLVANNINPLGKNFTKDRKNLLDKLLEYKAPKLKAGEKVSGFTNGKGGVTYDESTYYALAALTELYTKQSLFGVKGSIEVTNEEPPTITIEGIKNNELYRNDVDVKITSTKGNKWNATLNNKPFKGGKITQSDIYNLVVEAFDESGNKSTKTLDFILDKNAKKSVKVRIEGRDKKLFDKDVYIGDAGTNILNLLKIAVGCDQVEGDNKGSYGYFVTSILGNKQGSNYGWCYAVLKDDEVELPSLSMDNFKKVKDKDGNMNYDEIIFYVADYTGANVTTKLPKVEHKIDKKKLNLKISSVDGIISNKTILVEGKEYTTNDEGEVSISNIDLNKEFLSVYVGERNNIDGGIKIVPVTFKIKLNNKVKEQIGKEEASKPEKENKEDNKIKVVVVGKDKEFKLGTNGNVEFKVKNSTNESKDIALILCLYNDEDKLIDSVITNKNIKNNSNVNLEEKIKLPQKGKCYVKAFVWDNLDEMNSISKEIVIPVK